MFLINFEVWILIKKHSTINVIISAIIGLSRVFFRDTPGRTVAKKHDMSRVFHRDTRKPAGLSRKNTTCPKCVFVTLAIKIIFSKVQS